MNSFMSWVGGKKALRDAALARFPPYYERYIEVFGGAGWVLFHKPPGMDFEVINDYNSNLTNLYRVVRDKPDKLKYKLRYVLNSREDFNWIASLHKKGLFSQLNVKRHVKHKKRENPKKAVKKQNTPYKLRIYGVYEV